MHINTLILPFKIQDSHFFSPKQWSNTSIKSSDDYFFVVSRLIWKLESAWLISAMVSYFISRIVKWNRSDLKKPRFDNWFKPWRYQIYLVNFTLAQFLIINHIITEPCVLVWQYLRSWVSLYLTIISSHLSSAAAESILIRRLTTVHTKRGSGDI